MDEAFSSVSGTSSPLSPTLGQVVAPNQNGGASRPQWMDNRDRASFAVNSVLNRINEARTAERNCRRAFRKPYMGEVATWVADVYAEVGDIWQARLRELRLGTEDLGQPSQPSVGGTARAKPEDVTEPNNRNPDNG